MTADPVAKWRLVVGLAAFLALFGCATPPTEGPGSWGGRAIGEPPQPNPAVRLALIARAEQEWQFFGRQTVVIRGDEESIPHVGAWEDEDGARSDRVNDYWRAVGRPRLTGMDCQAPWSAAFISWLMQAEGVPEHQFPASALHGSYLAAIIEDAGYPGRYFVPRRVADYSPSPGDLICASRGPNGPLGFDEHTEADALRRATAHCDLVVAKAGRTLESIGGNVRNSISRTSVELDWAGRLQPVPRRSWFLILQNRL
jgi:hypothetical protein